MSNFHPLVSIVIPVYNGSNYMQCAINSALGQDYDNIEVIVVNDGSTDNTDMIAKSYGDKIRYFSKENGGVSTALNLAIKNAKGEYISWLSHDDYYLPAKISRQIEELRKIEGKDSEKFIVCCDCEYINEIEKTRKIITVTEKKEGNILTKLECLKVLYAWRVHGCAFLIPILAFKQVGVFDPNLRTTQDYYLWFKFINAGYLFYTIFEALVISRLHIDQQSFQALSLCYRENVMLWRFTKKLFYNEIKSLSKYDNKTFNIRKFPAVMLIKKYIYLHLPGFVIRIYRIIKKDKYKNSYIGIKR
jgi:glycosyltransferase involved in cell wall biosynthesis